VLACEATPNPSQSWEARQSPDRQNTAHARKEEQRIKKKKRENIKPRRRKELNHCKQSNK
jgi:hypothetical protein